jgi:glycosyltransferase involved in cell wall biosynthesis
MLVSILMPVRNQRRYIPQAVESIFEQTPGGTGDDVELVVADGASTDGTLEWLQALAARDDRVRVFSAPDTGPAQAINRALARARGTLIGWLNADDVYTAGAIRRALLAIEAHPDWLAVYGEGLHIDAEGRALERYPSAPPSAGLAGFADGCFICQPTVFFRRTFALLNGPLDETFRAAFDFEWWVRAFSRLQSRVGFLNEVQACTRLHANTITAIQRQRVIIESMQVVARYLGEVPTHWVRAWIREHEAQSGVEQGAKMAAVRGCFLEAAAPLLGDSSAERLATAAGLVEEESG